MKYLKKIEEVRNRERVGNKARSIRHLHKHRFNIPYSLVIPVEVHQKYRTSPQETIQRISLLLEEVISTDKTYAVRSSAEVEDHPEFSFAGQFKTVLDLKGAKQITDGIVKVWDSTNVVGDSEYRRRMDVKQSSIGMGVLIQEMVNPQWSGVGFSIHPVTGRHEMVIEGVAGGATNLFQQGQDPFRWIYSCAKEEFISTSGESDAPKHMWLKKLVNEIVRIRKSWQSEIDVEWAFDGQDLIFLQCRSVTVSEFPNMYSNHISREFLPGMIKPLVWSINIPVVNNVWISLLQRLLGRIDIQPEELSRAFYYRAYFNMGTMGKLFSLLGLPKQSLEYMMGIKKPDQKGIFRPGRKTLRYIPRMLFFLGSNLRLGKIFNRWMDEFIAELNTLSSKIDEYWSITAYPDLFRQTMDMYRSAAYYNILIPLTMQLTNQMLKRKYEKMGGSYHQLDFSWQIPRMKDFDPKYTLDELRIQWEMIPASIRDENLSVKSLRQHSDIPIIQGFLDDFDQFIHEFGYFSESGNDFSYPHWEEQPDFVLGLIRNAKVEAKPIEAIESSAGEKRTSIRSSNAYKRAQKYRLYREMISSQYTRGYGLFRKLFLHTGSYLKDAGILTDKEDVFYLTLEEHDLLLDHPDPASVGVHQEKIRTRKREMEEYMEIDLPPVIYGEIPPPLQVTNTDKLTGIPTSPGFFKGKIVVVRGYEEFSKEVDGSILVIPYADVGWTPLLLRSGAIVSESGGLLSHAAIVAREMSIPSISSVDHACKLEDGTFASVDGTNGTLLIIN